MLMVVMIYYYYDKSPASCFDGLKAAIWFSSSKTIMRAFLQKSGFESIARSLRVSCLFRPTRRFCTPQFCYVCAVYVCAHGWGLLKASAMLSPIQGVRIDNEETARSCCHRKWALVHPTVSKLLQVFCLCAVSFSYVKQQRLFNPSNDFIATAELLRSVLST